MRLSLVRSKIDRKEDYRQVEGLRFPNGTPIGSDPKRIRGEPLGETLLDGELVVDVDPDTGRVGLYSLLATCLALQAKQRSRGWLTSPLRP